jgi:uncharacterized protein (TIGR02217 family)
MSFINYPSPTPLFPALPSQGWSVHKKPIMSSRATTAITGRETKLACCVSPRWAFTVTYGGSAWLRDETQNIVPDPTLAGFAELEQISGLFLACRGAYGEFYYNDPDDNSRTLAPVATAGGAQSSFTLSVPYGNGPFTPSFVMPVGGINTIQGVYANGVLLDPSNYTIDATNTMIVFGPPPTKGTVLTASFSFYFRCRFLDDQQLYSEFAQNLWEAKEIRFESVKQ